jgi:hypothetical protein
MQVAPSSRKVSFLLLPMKDRTYKTFWNFMLLDTIEELAIFMDKESILSQEALTALHNSSLNRIQSKLTYLTF